MFVKAREDKELREKKEKEQQRKKRERGRQERGETSAEGRVRGFSIDKVNTTSDWSEEETETELERDKKRAAGSPAFATPDSKAVKTVFRGKRSQSPSKSRSRGPGHH